MFFLFTQTPLKFLVQFFWRDEAFSYLLAKRSIGEVIFLTAKDFNPPLYYILLHYWIKVTGSSEITLRLLSFLFYLGTIYILDHVMQDIFKIKLKNRIHYLILIAINPILIYYAFEARMYSMLAFFASLSYYAFYTRKLRLYWVAIFCGLFTHYFMLFVVVSQFIWAFITKKKQILKESAPRLILTLTSFFIWMIYVYFTKRGQPGSFWISAPNSKDLLYLPAYLYTGYEINLGFIKNSIGSFNLTLLFISAIIVFLFIIGYLKQTNERQRKEQDILSLLIIWALGIPLLVYIISFFKPLLLARYLIFSSVGIIVLIIYLLHKIDKRPRMIIYIALLFFTINYQILQVRYRGKEQPAKVLKEINKAVGPKDLVYVNQLDYFVALYYLPKFENKIFVFHQNYDEIPYYVGKVLIPRNKVVSTLPAYPQRAYILRNDGTYEIQAE